MSSLSVAQILMDAQRMASSVKDLDALGSALLVEAESNNRLVESLRKFQDDVDSLNRITNSKSNSEMVNRIQQQNANSSEILKENRELKVCIEDYERAMELIMQKYRELAGSRVLETKTNFKDIYNEKLWVIIREQREKINEMAAVMQHAASVDDTAVNQDIEIMSSLRMENKTLRELLQISRQFGNANRPIRSNELQMEEKAIQTEADDSADELSISVASVEHVNNMMDNTVLNLNSSNMNSLICTADVNIEDDATNCDNNNKIMESNGNTLKNITGKISPSSNQNSNTITEKEESSPKTAQNENITNNTPVVVGVTALGGVSNNDIVNKSDSFST